MRTIMVIDGADNCAYDCFLIDDDLFSVIFPLEGQDVEFIEDLVDRAEQKFRETGAKLDLSPLWENYVERKNVRGIDGILFYELAKKKKFYPNKRDSDLDGIGRRGRRKSD